MGAAEDFWLTGEDNGSGDAAAETTQKVNQNLGQAAQSAQALQKAFAFFTGGQVQQALTNMQQAFDPQRISAANAAWQKAGGLLQAAGSRPSIPPPLPAQPPPLPTGTAAIPSALQLISQQQSPVPQIGLKKQGPANIALQKQGDADIDLQMQKKGKGPRTQAEIDAEIDRAMGLKKEAAVAEGVDGGDKGGKGGKGKPRGGGGGGGGDGLAAGGLLKVQIVQPLPLPVSIKEQGGGRQAAFGGGTGGGGFGGMGGGTNPLAAANQAAGALQTMASAASPAIYKTLSGSIQILGAEIATVAVPAIMRMAYNLQLGAYYIRTMDADTKKAIATKLEFVGAIAAAGFAATKAVSAFGMVSGAIKGIGGTIAAIGIPGLVVALGAAGIAAGVAGDQIAEFLPPGLAEPVAKFGQVVRQAFGGLMEVAGPAIMQVGQSLMEFGQTILPVAAQAAGQLGGAIAAVAPILGGVLVTALQMAGEIIAGFAQGIQVINEVLGGHLPTVLAVAAGAFVAFRVAALAAAAAMSVTPFGLAATAIGGLVTALGLASAGMSSAASATKGLSDAIGETIARAERLQTTLERIQGGGKLESRDLKNFRAEDEAKLRAAGGDKEKQKAILKEIAERAKRESGGKSIDDLDRQEAEMTAEGIRFRNESVARLRKGGSAAEMKEADDIEAKFTDEEIRRRSRAKLAKERQAVLEAELANKALEQGGIDIGKKAEAKAEEKARGVTPPGAGGATVKTGPEGKPQPPGFKFAVAPPSSLTPQFSNIDQVRKQLQLAALQDPIDRQMLEIQRRNEQQMQESVKALNKIEQNTSQPPGLGR